MFQRTLQTTEKNSFFLFGPRGTGKTTFLQTCFHEKNTLRIDLLDPVIEDTFVRDPHELVYRIDGLSEPPDWVVLDGIQKAPRLLDIVHGLIEDRKLRFAMTGSSARKLRRGASNLLAGRAFVYHLFPLTHVELSETFDLLAALQWGALPKIFQLADRQDKEEFLRAYALTYLQEEIKVEQLVRKIDPFRSFLEIAAQCNGKIINFAGIAEDVGVDIKTVQSYFSILEDTLVGVLLPPFHRSIRKRQRANPKFYFFDTGVRRAFDRTLSQEIVPGTYGFGDAFEHFLITEIIRMSDYLRTDWRFSYLRTKDDAEIDLIIDRPGKPTALLEIKSSESISKRDVRTLAGLGRDLSNSKMFCLSLDQAPKEIMGVKCLPWQDGIRELGL